MLKLTLHPGDFIDIGEDIRVIFSGGSANNIHLLVDAPRDMNIARSTAQKNNANNDAHKSCANNDTVRSSTASDNTTGNSGKPSKYYAEPKLSAQAQKEIVEIIKQEKKNRRINNPTPKGN